MCTVLELIEKSEPLPVDATSAVDLYKRYMASVLDKVAQLKTRQVVARLHTPWYDGYGSIRQEKRERRQLERR